jgi:hypothetical protein
MVSTLLFWVRPFGALVLGHVEVVHLKKIRRTGTYIRTKLEDGKRFYIFCYFFAQVGFFKVYS